jgi:putative transposase
MENNRRYPSDVTDAEWEWIEPYIPKPKFGGRPTIHPRRTILNAIFYMARGGCSWRMLPKDLPPWPTVYDYYRQWAQATLWLQIHRVLRELVRYQSHRTPTATAAILDSQSVKMGDQAGTRGVDAGKKINGRKRHLLVDTLGLVIAALVTPANVQDQDGAKQLLEPVLTVMRRLQVLWADAKYNVGWLLDWIKSQRPYGKLHLEVVAKPPGQKGFAVLPKRWIGERTFGWLVKSRRLVRDYEVRPDHSEAFIYITMIRLMLRRLATV